MKMTCFVLMVAIAQPALAQVAGSPQSAVIDGDAYKAPQRLIDVGGGRHLNLYCVGKGAPVVVFDAGLGDSTASWAKVQPTIGKASQACSYDRAGLGFSDAATRPSDAKNDADDLHALLLAANIKPPYVLVGHSSAGMAVRVFADRYRSETAGLVIVDGSHEDQSTREWAIDVPKGGKARWDASLADSTCVDAARHGPIAKGTPAFKKCVGDEDPRYSHALNEVMMKYGATLKWQMAVASEQKSVFYASADETRATRRDFGDMPIIVLTHAPYPRNKNWTQSVQDEHTLVWEDMHNEVAAMSTHGVNEIVPRSGHFIQMDRPEIVIDAIDQVLAIARQDEAK
jgi:pimeloyl-ACP methyl ester carboxylesterase